MQARVYSEGSVICLTIRGNSPDTSREILQETEIYIRRYGFVYRAVPSVGLLKDIAKFICNKITSGIIYNVRHFGAVSFRTENVRHSFHI